MNKKSTNKSKKNSSKNKINKNNKNNTRTKIDIRGFIKNINKRKIIISIIIVIILLGGFLLVRDNYRNHNDKMNDLKIHYKDGKVISFNKFNNSFTVKKTITVKNTSDENKTYSLEWSKVSNTLKKQNVFLYEIKCTGPRCAELGKSQVPVAGSIVYQQVLIEAGKTQEYTVIFTYKGSEKDVKFNGELKVYSEVIDEKKIEEEQRKEEEKIKKELEKDKKVEKKEKKNNKTKA